MKSLPRTLAQLLDPNFLGRAPLEDKKHTAPLWMPCLSREEVDSVFKHLRLARIRGELLGHIRFWENPRLASLDEPRSFADGEIFFEAESWSLCIPD